MIKGIGVDMASISEVKRLMRMKAFIKCGHIFVPCSCFCRFQQSLAFDPLPYGFIRVQIALGFPAFQMNCIKIDWFSVCL